MCGIAGLLDFRQAVDRHFLEAMAVRLAHRGPDGEGIRLEGGVGFAHRRLSIIDPELGYQPMCTPDGLVWISYNGEIYNFPELRRELEGLNHAFRTNSDTEVVLQSYLQWGADCVYRFRGMFAFAIADFEHQQLFLARDHLGIKPLYYFQQPGLFAFASELQALSILPAFESDIDLEALDDYLCFDCIPPPRTIYRSVKKLPPGHRMLLALNRESIAVPERYWKPEFRPEFGRRREEWLEELDTVLRESVRAHLVSDVPFGAFLSGGLDSTAVVGYMAELLDRPVRCFTIGFEEEAFNEVPWARRAAERWGVEHEIEILKPDALGILPDLVRHYGEPFADSSAIPTYYVSRLAAQSVPMVLSGDGGDELFAGYRTYWGWMRWISWQGRPAWRKLLYPVVSRLRPGRYLPRKASAAAWLRFIGKIDGSGRRKLWRKELLPEASPGTEVLEEIFRDAGDLDALQAVQLADLRSYLPNDILTKVDVASMMNSLEVRTPLVDIRVAEFAARIPSSLNFGPVEGSEDVFEGKLLLKELLSRFFPKDFVHRRKQGFGVPVSHWFGAGEAAEREVRERLKSPTSPLHAFFRPEGIVERIQEPGANALWQMLFLDEWLRQHRQPR